MLNKLYILAFTFIFIFPSTGHTALIESDFLTSNDSLLTKDTESGMEWIDITYTQGASRTVVRNGYKDLVTTHGFRYATQSEVTNLFFSAGINNIANEFTESNHNSIEYLQSLIGVTTSMGYGEYDWANGPVTSGLVDFDPYVTFKSAVATMQLLDPTLYGRATDEDYIISDNVSISWAGSYLVREIQPVPIPAAFYLFTLGLISIFTLGRRQIYNKSFKS